MTAPDDAIAAAWVRGEEGALEQAYHRWGGLVHGLARRAVGADSADDVSQQVFVSAWRGRATYDPSQGPLGAWLVGITRRRIADHLRARPRLAEVPADPATLEPERGEWSEMDRDDLLAVYEELERIGDPQRRIVLLAHVQGLTHPEIAELVQLPLGTVKSHLTRTIARLRTRMGGDR
ncbi:RNA polymerase sigma factor [Ornithinimicrobium sp. Y1694]|uniref:RNA polymerase sigma factor n=1 Tax=Ornithinimicrobium sp. Y1694 TaxID=3418590 RepID=UPI003CF34CF0